MSSKSEKNQSWLEIDLQALKHNFQAIRAVASPAKIMAVVKANAYGHGAKEISSYLEKELSVDYFSVAYPKEALELKGNGTQVPILVLCPLNKYQIKTCIKEEIEITVSSKSKFEILKEVCFLEKEKVIKFQLEINTGMNRGGIEEAEVLDFLEKFFSAQNRDLKNFKITGIYSHLACDYQHEFTNKVQLKNFWSITQKIRSKYFQYLEKNSTKFHVIASSNLLNHRKNSMDLARVGISLYGLGKEFNKLDLKPVMSLKSRISLIRKIPNQSFVSYDLTWQAKRNSLIGVLPLGYADGVSRALSNKINFLYQDELVPQIGTICMDQLIVDFTGLKIKPKEGDLITLIGSSPSGEKEILIKDWSRILNTIDYEVACSLGNSRLKKVFKF